MYNFKKQLKVHLVYGGLRYLLDVNSDVTFSQTFSENSTPVKTLHNPHNFERGVITSANPASFSFSIPLIKENDNRVVFDLLLSIGSFDLYFVTNTDTYKLETCVIEEGQFNLRGIISMNISGTASKLTRVGTALYVLPGTLQVRTGSTSNYVKRFSVEIGGVLQDRIVQASISLQNRITWTGNKVLQSSLVVTDASNTIYPSSFVVSGRVLSGAIQQFIHTADTSSQTWGTTSIKIKADSTLTVNITNAIFTSRLEVGDLFARTYDFRMIDNPSNLTSILIYN